MKEPKKNVKKEPTEEKVSKFCCEICNFEAPNQSFLDMHLTKKQHKNNMLRKPFYCRVCDVKLFYKGVTVGACQMHLDGKKHKKNLEMSQRQKVA